MPVLQSLSNTVKDLQTVRLATFSKIDPLHWCFRTRPETLAQVFSYEFCEIS